MFVTDHNYKDLCAKGVLDRLLLCKFEYSYDKATCTIHVGPSKDSDNFLFSSIAYSRNFYNVCRL